VMYKVTIVQVNLSLQNLPFKRLDNL